MLRSRFSWIVLGCLAALAAAFVAGCSMDSGNPVASNAADTDRLAVPSLTGDHSQFVRFAQPSSPAMAKGRGGKDGVDRKTDDLVEKKIDSTTGGELVIGEQETMKITLTILPLSLTKTQIISMYSPVVKDDMLVIGVGGRNGVFFGPHGTTFDPSAELTIRSKSSNLVLPEGELCLYYWNEELWVWEATDQIVTVTLENKAESANDDNVIITLKTAVPHFSHYAFGARR